jgi:hypothetical protein
MIVRGINQMLAWGLLLGLAMRISAAEYEVDGHIEQTIYNFNGSIGAVEKSKFTVYVKDCSWLIKTTQSDTNGNPIVGGETACVNGSEIYEVIGPVDGENAVIGHNSRSYNTASIVSNNIPVSMNEGKFISHIWLMYASGCYFRNLSTNWLTPAYDINAWLAFLPNLKREAKWELVNGPGSLPMKVTYWNSQNEGGDINATYTATGVTNAGGIQVASGFVFEMRVKNYWASGPILPGKTVPEYNISKKAVASVTAIRPFCSRKDLTPTATGRTIVIDERPPRNSTPRTNLSSYTVKDGVKWLPFAEAKLAYGTRLASSQSAQVPPKKVSPAIIVVILLVPAAFVLGFWLLNRKR